jgi:hypothetical protein
LTGKVNELYDYDEEYDDNEDHYEPPAKKSKSDENNNTTQGVTSKYSKAHCYLHYQCFFPEFLS